MTASKLVLVCLASTISLARAANEAIKFPKKLQIKEGPLFLKGTYSKIKFNTNKPYKVHFDTDKGSKHTTIKSAKCIFENNRIKDGYKNIIFHMGDEWYVFSTRFATGNYCPILYWSMDKDRFAANKWSFQLSTEDLKDKPAAEAACNSQPLTVSLEPTRPRSGSLTKIDKGYDFETAYYEQVKGWGNWTDSSGDDRGKRIKSGPHPDEEKERKYKLGPLKLSNIFDIRDIPRQAGKPAPVWSGKYYGPAKNKPLWLKDQEERIISAQALEKQLGIETVPVRYLDPAKSSKKPSTTSGNSSDSPKAGCGCIIS